MSAALWFFGGIVAAITLIPVLLGASPLSGWKWLYYLTILRLFWRH